MPKVFHGDEAILAAVESLQRGGSADDFEVIFRKFFEPLRRFFAHQPALRDEAEDLAQATLFRAFERIHLYRPEVEGGFAAWLRTIAENVWKNAVREKLAAKRTAPGQVVELGELVQRAPDAGPSPEEAALARERTQVLREAIDSLPPGMRKCAELRMFADLKYQQIADIAGIGLNSVRSQLFEAKRRLKPVLDQYFQGTDF